MKIAEVQTADGWLLYRFWAPRGRSYSTWVHQISVKTPAWVESMWPCLTRWSAGAGGKQTTLVDSRTAWWWWWFMTQTPTG